jgi:hypothetical protein
MRYVLVPIDFSEIIMFQTECDYVGESVVLQQEAVAWCVEQFDQPGQPFVKLASVFDPAHWPDDGWGLSGGGVIIFTNFRMATAFRLRWC